MEDLKALSYLCHVLKIRGSDVIHPLCHVCYLGNKTFGTRYFHVNFLLSKYRSKKYLVRDPMRKRFIYFSKEFIGREGDIQYHQNRRGAKMWN